MPPEEAYPFAAACHLAAFCDLLKSIPPGARWITVRPNGPVMEGHAVLIRPTGQGAYRVIGGAGGKLNDYACASAGGTVSGGRAPARDNRPRPPGAAPGRRHARAGGRDGLAHPEPVPAPSPRPRRGT